MTNDTEIPQDTKIHKIDIDEEYKDKAIKRIKRMVSGNGADPEAVKLIESDGEVLQFQAENILTVSLKVSHKKVAGRVTGPIAVDNPVAAKEAINNAYLTLSQDVNMERQIKDLILKRDDQGFALDNNIIQIPFWKKVF